jgi:flagellar protein FliS
MIINGIESYRKTDVMTSDPKRLVIMCYEGAIDNLEMGKQRLLEKDYAGKSKAFLKAQDIITELLCSLDFEKGGSIARNLEALYNYMLRRLIQASINKDSGAVDEVIGMLRELKSAWEKAFYGKGREMPPEKTIQSHDMRQAVGI